jgi:hypothetical protein
MFLLFDAGYGVLKTPLQDWNAKYLVLRWHELPPSYRISQYQDGIKAA